MKNSFEFLSEEELLNYNGGGNNTWLINLAQKMLNSGLHGGASFPNCVAAARAFGKINPTSSNTSHSTTWNR